MQYITKYILQWRCQPVAIIARTLIACIVASDVFSDIRNTRRSELQWFLALEERIPVRDILEGHVLINILKWKFLFRFSIFDFAINFAFAIIICIYKHAHTHTCTMYYFARIDSTQ